MKRLLLLTLIFLSMGSAAYGKTNWNFFVPLDLYPHPAQAPPVVVVNPPSPPTPQYGYDQMPVYSFIGTVTAIDGDEVTVVDQRGATSTFKSYSASRNLLGKPIGVSDFVEIFPTGSRFNLIESIRLASPAPSSGNGNTVGNVETRLKKAKSLWEQDLITEEEYKATRQRILNDL